MRNEHAYYQSIAQILSYHQAAAETAHTGAAASTSTLSFAYNPLQYDPVKSSLPAARKAQERLIYMVGDSHSLPPAWSVMTWKGQSRLLVPKLATGVKQWHLRREGKFYPKANFENVVATIPSKADAVIVIIGEIDCREGLLQAVERDYHESLSKAMESTATNFVKGLKQLAAKKKWPLVMVHPVVPVLNETRGTVMAFNSVYRRVVERLCPPPTSASQPVPALQWLDILDHLVVSDTGSGSSTSQPTQTLNPIYHMDGTHLHPSYVRVMQDAMDRMIVR